MTTEQDIALAESLALAIPQMVSVYQKLRANAQVDSQGNPLKTVDELLADASALDKTGIATADSEIAKTQGG